MRSSSPMVLATSPDGHEVGLIEDRHQQAALKLQRKQRLEALVRKRKSNFSYLKVKFTSHCGIAFILKCNNAEMCLMNIEVSWRWMLLAQHDVVQSR